MAFFRAEKAQTAGIALGGIGSGSVELQPDGEFHYWQIANQSRWGGQCDQWEMDDGESHAGALFFYVRCKTDGKTVVRKLGMKTDPDDFTYRMFAWNKPVRAIEYDGCFPVCDLKYIDEALPVELKLSAAAPFKNCQAEAVWTGIGYAFSALCISAGLPDRAKRITGLIHDNQKRFGAFWSHWECGQTG